MHVYILVLLLVFLRYLFFAIGPQSIPHIVFYWNETRKYTQTFNRYGPHQQLLIVFIEFYSFKSFFCICVYKRSILLQNSFICIVYDAIMHDSSLNNCINLFIVNRVELPKEYNVKPVRCPLKAINIGSLQFEMFSFYKFK